MSKIISIFVVTIVLLAGSLAGGAVGTDFVAKGKKGGYTILMVNSASIITARILHPEDVNYGEGCQRSNPCFQIGEDGFDPGVSSLRQTLSEYDQGIQNLAGDC